jgi:hypothetical protein
MPAGGGGAPAIATQPQVTPAVAVVELLLEPEMLQAFDFYRKVNNNAESADISPALFDKVAKA